MKTKSKDEIREAIFKALSKTDLKEILETEGEKLSCLTEALGEFLNDRRLFHILTRESKMQNLDITLLTKNIVRSLSTVEALQKTCYKDIAAIFTAKFWRNLHAQCVGTSYEYSFSYNNNIPNLVIKDKDNNKVFHVNGFIYIGELMNHLIEDIDQFMLEYPEENTELTFWCYDALDFHNKPNKAQKQVMFINLSERLMLIEFINRSLLECCRYKPDKEDMAKRFTTRKPEAKHIKKETSIEVIKEADDEGFVTV